MKLLRFRRRRPDSLREPSDRARRVVLLDGHCRCPLGTPVEFVRGCGWLATGTWDACSHGA